MKRLRISSKRALIRLGMWVSLVGAALNACSTSVTEGTNTNWVKCKKDSDCLVVGPYATCENERCVASDGGSTNGERDSGPRGSGGPDATNHVECGHAAASSCLFLTAGYPCPTTWNAAVTDLCKGSDSATVFRCGAYDAISNLGFESSGTRFYDDQGMLVAYAFSEGSSGGSPGGSRRSCTIFSSNLDAVPSFAALYDPTCIQRDLSCAPYHLADAGSEPTFASLPDGAASTLVCPPRNSTPTGLACDVPGATCGGGCGWYCNCKVGEDGGVFWECVNTLC